MVSGLVANWSLSEKDSNDALTHASPRVTYPMMRPHRHRSATSLLEHTQGYSIGNAVTDKRFDGNALVPFAAGHSLISAELHTAVASACSGEYWNVTKGESDYTHSDQFERAFSQGLLGRIQVALPEQILCWSAHPSGALCVSRRLRLSSGFRPGTLRFPLQQVHSSQRT